MKTAPAIRNDFVADSRAIRPRSDRPTPQALRPFTPWRPESPKLSREEVQRIVMDVLG